MSQRYKMLIQYDGSAFSGWQAQKNGNTVQDIIEKALFPLGQGERIKVIGAGRTDSGVHALGQVAHFDLMTRLEAPELLRAVNARCPATIRIKSIEPVDHDFHARYSARSRHYRYQVYTGENILFRYQAWLEKPLPVDRLNHLAEHFVGDHDFLSFSKKNPDLDHTRCTVFQSTWTITGKMLTYEVAANRFLHHMVRYMVGTMVAAAQEKMTVTALINLLHKPREQARIYKAPAEGLFLIRVSYEDH
ncbi:MAG: tRNA pseudouridine(38-40) synthase TruA [Fidelibacterota bacterium]